jgi:carboxyvinyl-carboxyphosphonate phosphorylmutase
LNNQTTRTRLRALLVGQDCHMMATVFDPISSRIAEDIGYQAALMGGSLISHFVLGAPDLNVLTATELAEHVWRCARVSAVPLLVDADHGYGNALNVIRTVEELDRAGAAAVKIEDTLLPRAYGSTGAAALLSREESVDKIRAALKARGDSDMLVLGRTNASAITDVEDAIVRYQAFEAAGVDALFIPRPRSREQLDRIAAAVKLPLVLGGSGETFRDPGYLASRGVRLWSPGHGVAPLAVQGLYDAMKAVHDGTPPEALPGMATSGALLDRLLRTAEHDEATRVFLGPTAR